MTEDTLKTVFLDTKFIDGDRITVTEASEGIIDDRYDMCYTEDNHCELCDDLTHGFYKEPIEGDELGLVFCQVHLLRFATIVEIHQRQRHITMLDPVYQELLDSFCFNVVEDTLRSIQKDEIYDSENAKKGEFDVDIKEAREMIEVFDHACLEDSKKSMEKVLKEIKRQIGENV